jgi:NCAIR mutase (PurE)-related protein
MDSERLRKMLEDVKEGTLSVDEALKSLRDLPYEDLGFAKLDHHRALRRGFPEVVFCQNKTAEQVVQIMSKISLRSDKFMATRARPEIYEEVKKALPEARYSEMARIILVNREEPREFREDDPYILIISAGTSDIPVAEEAAVTAELLGSYVKRLYDVGVAGLHRLLDNREQLFEANVLIVIAGMEGALASVVGGLVKSPVIAVPTSVGYGASFGGLAALLSMLNSCAPGIAVVNIDNGFGAGFFAHLINR